MTLSDKIHNPTPKRAVVPNNWVFVEDLKGSIKELKEHFCGCCRRNKCGCGMEECDSCDKFKQIFGDDLI